MGQPVCPACGKASIKAVYKNIFNQKDMVKCAVCRLYFLWPLPSSCDGQKVYTKDYYNSWSVKELGEGDLAKMKRATFYKVLDILDGFKKGGSLLDVGCAFGHLLEAAIEKGWDAHGAEFCEYSAKSAAERIGKDRVWVGDFLKLPLPKEKFDVITMVDFLEHVCDVNAVLLKCKEALKKDGIMVVVTPNIDSFSRGILGKRWPHFKEEHPVYLSKTNTGGIFERNGFSLLKVANFRKAINFYYLRSQILAYAGGSLKAVINILNFFIPGPVKRTNLFIPQGEMVIVAQKR